MIFQTIKKLISIVVLAAAGLGALMLPGALRLPHYRRISQNGVVTIDDAVRVCQQTGLQGWDLVTVAQRLVARKFAVYSTINVWDSPSRAFVHGLGYCTQYNLALKELLDRLGFATQAVFSLKVQVLDNPDWTMGHTWLQVTIDGETRDVCAGRTENVPGKVSFLPLTTVYNGRIPILFLTHLGLVLFSGMVEWKAFLTKSAPPEWTYKELR